MDDHLEARRPVWRHGIPHAGLLRGKPVGRIVGAVPKRGDHGGSSSWQVSLALRDSLRRGSGGATLSDPVASSALGLTLTGVCAIRPRAGRSLRTTVTLREAPRSRRRPAKYTTERNMGCLARGLQPISNARENTVTFYIDKLPRYFGARPTRFGSSLHGRCGDTKRGHLEPRTPRHSSRRLEQTGLAPAAARVEIGASPRAKGRGDLGRLPRERSSGGRAALHREVAPHHMGD